MGEETMQPNNIQTTVTVGRMHCTRCESRYRAALEQIPELLKFMPTS
jgi:hypothetical protein